jgi:hypothetical protein
MLAPGLSPRSYGFNPRPVHGGISSRRNINGTSLLGPTSALSCHCYFSSSLSLFIRLSTKCYNLTTSLNISLIMHYIAVLSRVFQKDFTIKPMRREGVFWTHLAMDRGRSRALVTTLINLLFP